MSYKLCLLCIVFFFARGSQDYTNVSLGETFLEELVLMLYHVVVDKHPDLVAKDGCYNFMETIKRENSLQAMSTDAVCLQSGP